ncbi:MAG: hypothetical protein KatS3mg118_0429 [Paracoccaceae bacterium]|nr:MAG: hypothetical protein KatS3mg118_0429 [Paracoccaceae bacterium]
MTRPRLLHAMTALGLVALATLPACVPPPTQTRVVVVTEPGPAYDDERLTRAERRELQRLLRQLGQDPGPVDGVIGPQTRRAIRDWQAAAGRRVDGTVTRALLDDLRAAAAEMAARGHLAAPSKPPARTAPQERPAAPPPAAPAAPAAPPAAASAPPAEAAPVPASPPVFLRRTAPGGGDADTDSGGWN